LTQQNPTEWKNTDPRWPSESRDGGLRCVEVEVAPTKAPTTWSWAGSCSVNRGQEIVNPVFLGEVIEGKAGPPPWETTGGCSNNCKWANDNICDDGELAVRFSAQSC
jgi:hypothetical protein